MENNLLNNTEDIKELNVALENINKRIEKYSKDIIINYLGKDIEHKVFGKGTVVRHEELIIEVEFKDKSIRKFRIPDVFMKNFIYIDKEYQEQMKRIIELTEEKERISEKINRKKLYENENKKIVCKEAKICINKGKISINDEIYFRTIRDVSDLFNKNYRGLRGSWIKIDINWNTIAGCFQMPDITDKNLYKNVLSADGKCFYYTMKREDNTEKEEAVEGIIKHEMQVTYLFLKYPNTLGYKFVGIFRKDNDEMKKSIKDKEYKVVYKRIGDELDITQFFNNK